LRNKGVGYARLELHAETEAKDNERTTGAFNAECSQQRYGDKAGRSGAGQRNDTAKD